MTADPARDVILHASAVAYGAQAVLITGRSGSGKSALALQLMALGGTLVSDDQTILTPRDGALFASAPTALRGLIEARFVGLLAAETTPLARVALVIDMDQTETHRLPPERTITLCGVMLPCVHKVEGPHFPSAVIHLLKSGRVA